RPGAYLVQDQRPVLGEVAHHLLEDLVPAEASRVADVRGEPSAHRRHVEDVRHPLLETASGREETKRVTESLERGSIAEPRERNVEPVLDTLFDQQTPKPGRRLPLGDPRPKLGRDVLGAT